MEMCGFRLKAKSLSWVEKSILFGFPFSEILAKWGPLSDTTLLH
jgi:hypothetical protein